MITEDKGTEIFFSNTKYKNTSNPLIQQIISRKNAE